LPVPPRDQLKLKDPSAFRYIGKGQIPIVDGFDITTGKAVYGIDAKLPGLKYAVVARPPVFGGKVASLDSSAAMKVPGVEKIVQIDGTPAPAVFQPLGGVAVVARNTWAAMKGREALKITWDDGPNRVYDSLSFKKQLEETSSKRPHATRPRWSATKGISSARSPAPTVSSRASTTFRTWRTPRWNPRLRPCA
jgi:isoquinoline 1-oxidoreductase beta subunit